MLLLESLLRSYNYRYRRVIDHMINNGTIDVNHPDVNKHFRPITNDEFIKRHHYEGDAVYNDSGVYSPHPNDEQGNTRHNFPVSTHVAVYHPASRTVFAHNTKTNEVDQFNMDDEDDHRLKYATHMPDLDAPDNIVPVTTHLPDAIKRDDYKAKLPHYFQKHYDLAHEQNKFDKTMTPDHKMALKKYLGPMANSYDINGHLLCTNKNRVHGLSNEEAQKHADNLHDYISRHGAPLKEPLNVYSGVGSKWDVSHEIATKGTLQSPAFISASLNPSHANGFALGSTDGAHVLHFRLPKGFKNGAYVDHHNPNPDQESEYLLNKNQKWRHVGSKQTQIRAYNGMASTIHTLEPIEE